MFVSCKSSSENLFENSPQNASKFTRLNVGPNLLIHKNTSAFLFAFPDVLIDDREFSLGFICNDDVRHSLT